ncbi:hypothetical protein BROUX41_000533 [Berkeleyomyces rouxiae]
MPSTAPTSASSAEPAEEPTMPCSTSTSASTSTNARKTTASSRGTRAPRGRARGNRGRGRGGRQATAGRSNAGVGQGRKGRGRIKQFGDPMVQACYERSREIKDHYNTLVAALRPALADLAQRSADKLVAEPHSHELSEEYRHVTESLNGRLASAIDEINLRFHAEQKVLHEAMDYQHYVIEEQTKNAFEDIEDQFVDAQMNRLRILEKLHDLSLPVDIADIEHVFKAISSAEYENFGPFVDYDEEGHVVPYPSRVPGTQMYELAQKFARQYKEEKAAATAAAQEARQQARALAQQEEAESALNRKRGGERASTIASRRNPRSSTRGGRHNAATNNSSNNSTNTLGVSAAAVGNGDEAADNDDDEPATAKHPMGILGGVGDEAVDLEPSTAVQEPEMEEEDLTTTSNSELPVRERSPPPPTGMQPPDEYGAAIVISRGKGHNRIMIRPPPFEVDDIEIGFRDSSNDPTRGPTVVANRGKYTGTPYTGSIHIDPMLWNYDARANREGDLDEELVEKHKLHPSYGFFLRTSRNPNPVPEERPDDIDRGHSVVYLPPGDLIVSACRSTVAMICEKVNDASKAEEMKPIISEFCKMDDIAEEEITPDFKEKIPPEFKGYSLHYPSVRGDRVAMRRLLADEAVRAEKLAASIKQEEADEASDVENDDAQVHQDHQEQSEQSEAEADTQGIDALVQASILASAQGLVEDPSEQRSSYDAIRDVFRPSAPEPPRRETTNIAMLTLAAACDTAPRFQEFNVHPPPVSMPPMQRGFGSSSNQPQPVVGYESATSVATLEGYPGSNKIPHGHYEQAPSMEQAPEYYNPPDSMSQYNHGPNIGFSQPPAMGAHRSPLPPLRPAAQSHISTHNDIEPTNGFYSAPPPEMSSGSHHAYQYPPPGEHMVAQKQPLHQQGPTISTPASNNGFYQGQPSPGSFSSPNPYENHLGQQQLSSAPSRDRSASVAILPPSSTLPPGSSASSAAKYRKLEPAPVPKHRRGWHNEPQPQLRTVGYDPSNDIKDYAANEPLPGRAPAYIRAWSHNSSNVRRRSSKKDGERRDAE